MSQMHISKIPGIGLNYSKSPPWLGAHLKRYSPFFLLVIISIVMVQQGNKALADEPKTNDDEMMRLLIEMHNKAHPYRPFSAIWPGSDGLLLEIQLNSGTTSVVYSVNEVTDQYFSSFITSTINHLSSTLNGVNTDPHFSSSITSIINRLSSILNGGNTDQTGVTDEPEIKVVFVRKGLMIFEYDQIAVVPPSLIAEDDLSCRLESPWVRLDIQRSPVLRIHAVFFWNERQFLIDQAILSGEPASDFSAVDSEAKELPNSGPSDHFQFAPPELLRLLERPPFLGLSRYSDRAPSSGRPTTLDDIIIRMNTLNDHMVKHYPILIQTLFDQCFSSEQYVLQRYKTILDIRDVVPLDEYQFKRIPKN